MKIGIVVHSHTGNTFSVAKRLQEMLNSQGNEAVIERLVPVDEEGSLKGNFNIKEEPNLSDYEVLIFAAPVWGFSLSGVMKNYLAVISSLKDKKIMCFITKALFVNGFGGEKTINKIIELTTAKGGEFMGYGIVCWKEKKREIMTLELLEKFRGILHESSEKLS